MPCDPIVDGSGRVVGIACSRGSRRRTCACGKPANYLCDAPKGRGTCDAPVCGACKTANPSTGKDFCRACARPRGAPPSSPEGAGAAPDRVRAPESSAQAPAVRKRLWRKP